MRRPSLVLIPILAAGLLAVPALDAASPQELEQIRAALLADRPRPSPTGPAWTDWQVSDIGCDGPGLLDWERWEILSVVDECGLESLRFVYELCEVVVPADGKGHLREGAEFAGEVGDLSISALKCAARGVAVHVGRRAGKSESEIEAWRKRVDGLGEIASIVSNLRDLYALSSGGGARTVGKNVVKNVGNAANAPKTADGLSAAWHSFHGNRMASFDRRLKGAKILTSECRLPETEALFTELAGDVLDYLRDARLDVVHYEKRVFCDAAGAEPGLAVSALIAASPHEASRKEALQLEAEVAKTFEKVEQALRDARKEAATVSRERDTFFAEVDAVIGRYDAARLACDRAGLLGQRRELERFAAHRCATGTGKGDDIARAIGRIDRAIGAVDEAALPLGTARDDVRSALRACRTQAAREALDRGREALRQARSSSPIPLQACPEVELWFPAETLVAEIDGRRKALAEAKQKAHGFSRRPGRRPPPAGSTKPVVSSSPPGPSSRAAPSA